MAIPFEVPDPENAVLRHQQNQDSLWPAEFVAGVSR